MRLLFVKASQKITPDTFLYPFKDHFCSAWCTVYVFTRIIYAHIPLPVKQAFFNSTVNHFLIQTPNVAQGLYTQCHYLQWPSRCFLFVFLSAFSCYFGESTKTMICFRELNWHVMLKETLLFITFCLLMFLTSGLFQEEFSQKDLESHVAKPFTLHFLRNAKILELFSANKIIS